MSIPVKQPPFNNVVAGSTAIISRLDQGETCDALVLRLQGGTAPGFTVAAHIDLIKVRLGNKTIAELTGAEIEKINKEKNRNTSDSLLVLHFSDPQARTIVGQQIGAIDTSVGYSSFSIEVKINAAAVDPVLDCWMLKSPPKMRDDQGYHLLFRSYLRGEQTYPAAKTYALDVPLGSDEGVLLHSMHLIGENDTCTQIDVKRDGLDIQDEGDRTVMEFIYGEDRMTKQAGMFTYAPAFDGNQSKNLKTLRDNGKPAAFKFLGTFSGADNVVMISEVISVLQHV
ncbi:major capsid protein P2 [uncultured Amphritea sp.]|uniref:major capsid protein P2 n=1 Tax=uncultured Amphritea sp. TaxID=981605 RepID=UPI0026330737|nr:major capsid protein P2 [uncultured Amphritea sp.]